MDSIGVGRVVWVWGVLGWCGVGWDDVGGGGVV